MNGILAVVFLAIAGLLSLNKDKDESKVWMMGAITFAILHVASQVAAVAQKLVK